MIRVALVAALLCLLAACGQSGVTATRQSPGQPTPAAFQINTSPSPAATATASTIPGSAISCRLPVLVPTSAGSHEPPGGWVTFPGGQYQRDPSSTIAAINHEPSYDWPLRRWVPVESVDVSPDGTHYLLDQQPGSLGSLYLVDAETGSKQVIYSTPDYRRVIAYTNHGIYLSDTGINPSPGLWLLDPAAGTAKLIPGSERTPAWMLVGADAAWTVTGVPGMSGQTVLRLDLTTGQVASWYQSPLPVGLLALDGQGRPLISLLGDTVRIGVLQDQNHFQEFQLPGGVQSAGSALTATSQTWLPLQRDEGVALFTGSSPVQIFKTQTGPYAFSLAGGCF